MKELKQAKNIENIRHNKPLQVQQGGKWKPLGQAVLRIGNQQITKQGQKWRVHPLGLQTTNLKTAIRTAKNHTKNINKETQKLNKKVKKT